jgi:DNA invertase Pin-like site-specific DNA recombinase
MSTSNNTNGNGNGHANGKPLHFAALVRVSTEAQERQGESLLTQRKANARDVARLGGTVVGVYGGQEHATPGWERKEVDRLLADAARGKFDAVMVAYVDRWSRDNAKSKEGLDALRKAGVRFFVGSMEMNLFDPQHRFIIGMNAEVGEFVALQQTKKSLDTRLERLQKGIPSAGRLPFGRTFDRRTNAWGTDPKKQALVADVAARYLAGEPLPKLAEEYGVNHSQLCLTLRERCGTRWVARLDNDALNVHEEITLTVPALLDEATIRRVRQKLTANRTYVRSGGRPVRKDGSKSEYLLSGRIFCAACGCNLCGSTDRHGVPHYNHTHADAAKACTLRPRPWVRADKIEDEVVGQLFNMFGNPAAIERAVRAAVPDADKALARRQRLEADLEKVGRGRERILALVAADAVTEADAAKQLGDLKGRAALLREELDKLAATLAEVPTQETIQLFVERFGSGTRYGNVRGEDGEAVTRPYDAVEVIDDSGQTYVGGNSLPTWLVMTRPEKRALVEAAFASPLADGTPAGVYVEAAPGTRRYQRGKRWTFTLRGRLEFEAVLHAAETLRTRSETLMPHQQP